MNSIYDAIRERENQIAALQAQISDIQIEIEALRVAARIMEEGGKEAPRPMPVQPAAVQPVPVVQPVATVQTAQPVANNGGIEKKRVWP
ncbi:MAG TPA: hypothetical protein VFK06_17515 [Candidatus Angelobacter sp.]|nr:hypothetical protein [Candidatus Angelobacter sp.]